MFCKKLVFSLTVSLVVTFCIYTNTQAATWYISPNGSDANTGSSTASPIKTFNKAWGKISRGDTLILMDGTYTPGTTGIMSVSLPSDNGQRIYIKAQNIGKAVIDAQYQVKSPVDISKFRGGANLEIDGIVAKNGGSDSNQTSAVYYFEVSNANILLKNVAGYNADKDANSSVFSFYQSSGVTLEDCIAAGSGRKMVMLYQSSNNTIRRCIARWMQFDGAKFCGGLSWPAGSGMEVYYGNNNILENNIGFGNVAYYHFALKGYNADNIANNNKYLGNMSLFAGKYADGTKVNYGSKPSNSLCSDSDMTKQDMVTAFQTIGLSWDETYMSGNLFQDNLAYKAGGLALTSSGEWYGAGWSNNTIRRATFVGNNSFRSSQYDMSSSESNKYTVESSSMKLSNGTQLNSGKAQLQYRYVNGSLTSQPLWPWPMEAQVKEQFKTHLAPTWGGSNPDLYDFSVTQRVCENILKGDSSVAAVPTSFDCWAGGPAPTPLPSPTPMPSATPSPTPTPVAIVLPTKIEAENFVSSLGSYMIVDAASASGAKRLGYLNSGSTFIYRVSSSTTSNYNFAFATSTTDSTINKTISLYIDNESTPRGTVTITPSGSWDTYKEHILSNISITSGAHDIKVVINSDYFDFDYINITKSGTTVTPTPVVSSSPTKTPTPMVSPTVNLTFDVNSDGKVNLLDVIAVLNEIFK